MATIQWDIDPRDRALPGVAAIEDDVLTNARNGGIVEMHDGGGPRQETIDALPTIITTLRKRGYRFVTITQMLGYRLIYKENAGARPLLGCISGGGGVGATCAKRSIP